MSEKDEVYDMKLFREKSKIVSVRNKLLCKEAIWKEVEKKKKKKSNRASKFDFKKNDSFKQSLAYLIWVKHAGIFIGLIHSYDKTSNFSL